jgi:hypothetical protein
VKIIRVMVEKISVDNFRIDTSDDKLVADHVDAYYVDTIVAALNATYSGDNTTYLRQQGRYFKAVPDDYELRTYEP